MVIPLVYPPDLYPGHEPGQLPGAMNRIVRVMKKWANVPVDGARGAGVAVENISRTLLEVGQATRLVVPRQHRGSVRNWIEKNTKQSYETSSIIDLESLIEGSNFLDNSVWVDPAAFTSFALRLRNYSCRGDVTSPLISIQHTLSVPRLLESHFPSLLQEPTFACDSLVCGSESAKIAISQLINHLAAERPGASYKGRIDVMPLPVDTDRYRPGDRSQARRALKLPAEGFICLYVGHVSPLKADWTSILGTISKVVLACKQKVTLLLAGTVDPSNAKVIRHLESRFAFMRVMGPVTGDDKVLLYQAADLFISPADTLNESFGLSPVEAMACGLPQLVTHWNGYKDTVVHGVTGFLIKTYWQDPFNMSAAWGLLGDSVDHLSVSQQVVLDHQELSTYLGIMISNRELLDSMRTASRAHALAQYSIPRVAARYRELISEVSAIAGVQGVKSSWCLPKTTNYFACFAQYATSNELGEMVLSIGGREDDWKEIFDTAPQELDLWIDRECAVLIVGFVQSISHMSLTQVVVAIASEQEMEHHKVWWHCCWLVKHGVLRFSMETTGSAQSVGGQAKGLHKDGLAYGF